MLLKLNQCVKSTKEIGVRKVLGALVGTIMVLVSRGFFKMVGLSFLISIPLVFVISGVLSIAIAALAVGGQSWRAAVSNPVKTLRYK